MATYLYEQAWDTPLPRLSRPKAPIAAIGVYGGDVLALVNKDRPAPSACWLRPLSVGDPRDADRSRPFHVSLRALDEPGR
jgi:hypothetical protein